MKKAILAAATAITFVGCDQITNSKKEPAIPATQKTFWQNVIQEAADSGNLKPQALDVLNKSEIVVKRSGVDDKLHTASEYKKTYAMGFFMANKTDTTAFFNYTETLSGTSTDVTARILFHNTASVTPNDTTQYWQIYKFDLVDSKDSVTAEQKPSKFSKGDAKSKNQILRYMK